MVVVCDDELSMVTFHPIRWQERMVMYVVIDIDKREQKDKMFYEILNTYQST